MEKKDLLSVRKKTAAAKRRRKVVAPAKAGSAGRLAKAIADYLAFDSYMYAPLLSDPPLPAAAPSQPPATAAPSAALPSAPPGTVVINSPCAL
ncbi:hypothetical protein PR202_ga21114 [Eleusine coracana subsp. coracana]|uniref:Uncharacterized protein n=1 Tax=Eleusine coracana subsp. coracana TaxID=191504 RepID=A0AAV5CZU1_ELECO|nr:hypothetical protein PR202_ga21114 [Eleusine coracana subsp. coracana]